MRRHAVELVIVLVVIAGLAFKASRNWMKPTNPPSSSTPALAAGPSGQRPLLYWALVNRRHRIYRVDWDGSGHREIWAGGLGSQPCFPVLSPDGQWAAFLDDRGGDCLCVVSSQGGADRVLARQLGLGYWIKPQWSPDSRNLLFERREGGQIQLCSVGLEGGEPQPLRAGRFGSWSPDGKRMLYRAGNDWRVDDLVVRAPERLAGGHWSPDSRYIVAHGGASDHSNVYLVEAATGQVRLIQKDARNPVFSPDGKRIAFDSFRSRTDTCDVYVMDADGSEAHLLHARGGRPMWQDDRIVFTGHPEGDPKAYVAWGIRPNGRDFHEVVRGISNLGVSWP